MEEITVPEQKKGIRIISLLPVLVFLLILSVGGNIFLILMINNIKINGNYISGEFLQYTKPLDTQPIDSNNGTTNYILQYQNLKPIIQTEIGKYNDTGGSVGVFVQDAKTGAWLGIHEKTGFYPASILKIPIMMAILKKIQLGEMKLSDTITLTQEDLDSGWGDLYKSGAGAKFTVQQLLEDMIKASDNTAKNALKRQLTLTEIDEVFVHVGIPDPYITDNGQTVSPRDYTRLFKALYYSTFLSPHYSEIALELATNSREEDLISKDLPDGVQVSQKFGIAEEMGVLHDCGVVYHQKNPYFICIMTSGINTAQSEELIPKLSKDVYDYVDKDS